MEENKTGRLVSEDWMKKALELAEKGRGQPFPHPWIGCVIVRDDHIVGEGFGPKAESIALEQAGERAQGATAYITLESSGDAFLKAGVKKVVAAVADPSTNGLEMLKAAGVETHLGLFDSHAEKILAPYLYHKRTGLPYVVLKTNLSIDGKLGEISITSEEARHDANLLRAESNAILIGSETALLDKPKLTAPGSPLRVLLDGRGRVKASKHLFDIGLGPTLVYTTAKAGDDVLAHWNKLGIEVVKSIPAMSGIGVHLPEVLMDLGKRGVVQLLVEGGSSIAGSFLAGGHVQKLILYMGNVVLGAGGQPAFNQKVGDATRWKLEDFRQFDDTIRLKYGLIRS